MLNRKGKRPIYPSIVTNKKKRFQIIHIGISQAKHTAN